MEPITPTEFFSSAVSGREDGKLILALFGGPARDPKDCVAILVADRVTARNLLLAMVDALVRGV